MISLKAAFPVVLGFVQGGAECGLDLDNLKSYILPSRDPALPQGKPLPEWIENFVEGIFFYLKTIFIFWTWTST